jgi:hypothetical protein
MVAEDGGVHALDGDSTPARAPEDASDIGDLEAGGSDYDVTAVIHDEVHLVPGVDLQPLPNGFRKCDLPLARQCGGWHSLLHVRIIGKFLTARQQPILRAWPSAPVLIDDDAAA